MVTTYILLIPLFLYPVLTVMLPPLTPCNVNDQNQLDECVLNNFRTSVNALIHGDPKLGIPTLDPVDIKEIIIEQKNDRVGFELVLTDCKFSGDANNKYIGARTDLKKRHIEWDISNSAYTMIGTYNISGRVLLLPITGSGKVNFTLIGLKSKFSVDYGLMKKKGKNYIDVQNVIITSKPEKLEIELENLFNGNKLLGDNMNQILNDNWEDLSKDVAPEISRALSTLYKRVLSVVFSLTPYDAIFPEQ